MLTNEQINRIMNDSWEIWRQYRDDVPALDDDKTWLDIVNRFAAINAAAGEREKRWWEGTDKPEYRPESYAAPITDWFLDMLQERARQK